ncbi:hypothetical protein PHET_10832 [Paragonimus heterotremus]|uniref:Rabaptin coiled-coil domain-containing protein n=1 Tax=Paragonimus heterotremus TaxID=100268 RepID=A0A8J4T6C3_9TREM|nr:hypothetical protein PHET_10832 [Paragonimus heterotremus]
MDDQQRTNDETVLKNNVDRYSEVFTNPVKLPDFVSDIYNDLSNPDLRERLQTLLSQYALDLARCRADYLKATVDADTVRERLHNTEVELEDVRSAAALVIDGQDEALLNLKRRYDEELASLRSVSEHQVAELRVASQKWLETLPPLLGIILHNITKLAS